ncbi:CubicO group peptidase (beta-lactamase class C family) [Herbihabitans rhizosphaerae]|uniref:CubicO group peptidase (Beta-lactamase class C family) n=1 Tax=Herbihabitans rhizosphaerae TaxID=1872711 RepID=A0A4Q7KVD7_9PSEU|nr:serine hydrolase domain-containing protein [Herbihabitans rhizosphaerae]RZS40988.1 CubicO group peptidase (beta-lactamase class C family) [Herbihabitans rhizosphaerae]
MLATTEFALLRKIAEEQAAARAPSLVAAITRGDGIAWWGGRGEVDGAPPTVDTQYRIGSITKTFVAVLVMRLRDEGKLDVTDPLDKHVPGTALGDLTIAQLLSHTGGLTSESPGDWWERAAGGDWATLESTLDDRSRVLRAGKQLHYSNPGFAVLGEVVARLRGRAWDEVLDEEILAPLGMSRTTRGPVAPHALGWAVHPYADVLLPEPTPDNGAMAPAGTLWSTVTDLGRWARFLAGDTGDVLHPDTLTEMATPITVDEGDVWRIGWGLGLQLFRENGRRLIGHGGSMPGFLATVAVDPRSGTGVLTMANSTSGVRIAGLSVELLSLVDDYEPVLPTEWRPRSDVDPALLSLTGQWFWGPTAFLLRALGDGWLDLAPADGKGRASRFRPTGVDTWVGLDGYFAGETLTLHRDTTGTATHLDLATFIFSRTPYDPAAPIPGGVDPSGWR